MIAARRPRSPRGTGSQLRSEILAATADLLERTGNADAVSIRAVGKLVGVSAPSIYRHFADKDELIDAVVAQVFEDLDAAMRAAIDDPDAHPIVRLHHLGMAYVRFALDHPEQYRLATAPAETRGAVDQVLTSSAFQYMADAVQDAMTEGLIDADDPTPIVLELWSAAHGIASLLLAKPYLPWGDPMAAAERVLAAACAGHIVMNLIGEQATPEEAADWFARLRDAQRSA